MTEQDTIIALATPSGSGAIAVIRLSGPDAIERVSAHFKSVGKGRLTEFESHTVHLGGIYKGERLLDEVLVTLFRAPRSYTGENIVEISCHGSSYIQQEILQHFLKEGCRMARAGEFTLRAFLNGKMDLSQAEAVADLIASENEASHQLALRQMRGGYSTEIQDLRDQLIHFASMITLELDFSGEDVEFADRAAFHHLLEKLSTLLKSLIDSFAMGNVIKKGIPIAISGQPNVGKSTLLNALLKEEKAIVSDIAGTTRDAIEDEISLNGIGFRFIDTAGIRETQDTVEKIGIQRTLEKMQEARILIYMMDATELSDSRLIITQKETAELRKKYPDKPVVLLVNKIDLVGEETRRKISDALSEVLFLSAKTGEGLEELQRYLLGFVETGFLSNEDPVVSNSRHYEALLKALEAISKVQEGVALDVPSDLLSIDINQALYHLGEITGAITSDDLLGNIFANFCIGK
ncbi:tRNA uridine-5-carboxymethylaminomethyl(34) synthesis GTPase MnmE [Robiginitalea aurantiaca]|uniref:tRNA modification GTPase MnmE n=1 Tax=Robiginitalea aurantiaca TaxID=3056915 RepID=A0ABT7WH19_9FLAO|nr:tRNA uridine-5-carboxymethylaminomethyl(34) synthesis GTPase MnmE [Robiginitalea aurantiaca]MDM9632223.1 tRNA uridine-5-carboxymethylaminomethyl(34) synthesis GTPase MnmE [Robiginitalea aurantiaca]